MALSMDMLILEALKGGLGSETGEEGGLLLFHRLPTNPSF